MPIIYNMDTSLIAGVARGYAAQTTRLRFMSSFDRLKGRGRRVMRLGCTVWWEVRQQFPEALRKATNGARQVGVKTRRDRAMTLRRFVFWVVAEFEIHSVTHLKPKHLQGYCSDMEKRKLRPATIATELSHISVLLKALGKSQFLDDRQSLFSSPSVLHRSLVAKSDKSNEGAGLDLKAIFAAAWALNQRVAVQLALCWHLGLRAQEAWCFRPHLAVRDGFVRVRFGTKGGRPRSLAESLTEEQREVIELAKTFAATEAESTVPRGCSLKNWKTIFYRVTRRIGLTRAGLGVTPHSLRHSRGQRQYQCVTGHLAPVQGGTLAQDDPYADRAAREIVSSDLGHSRGSISAAYLGGTRVPCDRDAGASDAV